MSAASSVAETTLDKIQKTSGLPKGIDTEQQLWDEIFKKEVYEMPFLLFPLICEIHGKEYPKEISITPIATEFSVEKPDTKKLTSIRSDVTMQVGTTDIFHFECESSNDLNMGKRMYDYDSRVALTYSEKTEKGRTLLRYPYSAVLYLKPGIHISDDLICQLIFPPGKLLRVRQGLDLEENADGNIETGGAVEDSERTGKAEKDSNLTCADYTISAVKVQSYTLQEIRQKRLLILIPFTPIRFRPILKRKETNSVFAKRELTDFLREIILILDEAVKDDYISEKEEKIILMLLGKAMIRVFYKTSFLQEVVQMTAPVLELEWETVARLEKEIAGVIAEKNAVTAEKDAITAEKDAITAEKDAIIAEMDAEIRRLRERRRGLFYRRRPKT